jgi:hypothetical protein
MTDTHGNAPARTLPFLSRHPRAMAVMDRLLRPVEIIVKKPFFGCRMCGQCVLHETGLTCPMGCPKTLRNGPCGGVRTNGHCEVRPEMRCVWVRAERRSRFLPWRSHILKIQPALDWTQKGSSSWINAILGRTHGMYP